MDEILGQLGGLLLGSVPTIIFVILLFGIYTAVVHKPLTKVLAERHSRTEGAIEKARADIAQAEARTADYEQRLREARMTIFKSQEARRQQALAGAGRGRGRGADQGASPGGAGAGRHRAGQGGGTSRSASRERKAGR